MNYFAHALPFLDEPYFAAATSVPDMLVVVDRQVRLRSKHALPFRDHADPTIRAVAGGLLQHFRDDTVFHGTRAFFELSLALSVMSRDVLDGAADLGPRLLGHLLVELLLDSMLIADNPARLEYYYQLMQSVDAEAIQEAVNRMTSLPTERLAPMFAVISRERFLSDYLDDDRLLKRLNQIMHRVGLAPLPKSYGTILPDSRRLVASRRDELLEGIPS